MQRSLIRLGYAAGPLGRLSQEMVASIRAYQQSKGLLETGQPSIELLRHMIRNGG